MGCMNGLLDEENKRTESLLSAYGDADYDLLYENIKLPAGLNLRVPYKSELEFFEKNPNVSGMATEDGKIILNKFSKLTPQEFQSVAVNEGARLMMKGNEPDFDVPDYQRKYFAETPYEGKDPELKATIAARILSGDPSVKDPTEEQLKYVQMLKKLMGM